MRTGFSLVELSIVLVILGLLTGGILAGQSLIRASELRAVSTEFNRFQTAAMAFRDKYADIPGDMATATKFFGRMTTDSACLYSAGTAVDAARGVCNGTGSGGIDTTFGGTGSIDEPSQFWRHLAAAGLIEGSYTGRYNTAAGSLSCETGGTTINCPPSKLGNTAQWFMMTFFSGTWEPTVTSHYLYLGSQMSGANSMGPQGVLRAEEAWNIDTKMDDGKPGTGIVHGRAKPTCYSGTEYALNLTGLECFLEIKVRL